jgi:hypothetical protein
LLKRGAGSVEPLLSVLREDIGLDHYKDVLRILVELKDSRAEETFRLALRADDEAVRATAARGLYLLGVFDVLDACIATLNDAPDPLHFDITPAVQSLCEMGITALPAILPLLDSADERTRQRAQKVLELVSFKEVSDTVQPRPLSDHARAEWSALWRRNGSYQWNAPEAQRQSATRQWRNWLEERLRNRQ